MKFWWWNGAGPGNFGDVLTPKFLEYFGIPHEFSWPDFEAISIGSIAKVAQPGTLVLGSGMISARDTVCAEARWMWVRGPHTRDAIVASGGTCPEIYGDPALMLPLLCDESTKKYDLGIVPHYSQYKLIKDLYPGEYVIDLRTNDPVQTAKDITSCRRIISSSLHGIICAHAYGIPAAWVKFGDIKGDDIKFRDHYASVNLEPRVSTVEDPWFTTGEIKIDHMIDIFQSLKL